MSYRKRILACLLVSIVATASAAIAIEEAGPHSRPADPSVSSATPSASSATPSALSLDQTSVAKARSGAALSLNRTHTAVGKHDVSGAISEEQTRGDFGKTKSSLRVDFASSQQRPLSKVVALVIALRMGGFAPAEITRPAGDYFISVSNLTGLDDLVFRLDREGGERLHSKRIEKEKRKWRQNVRLSLGTYLLTEMNHPEWVCRITITQ